MALPGGVQGRCFREARHRAHERLSFQPPMALGRRGELA